MSAKTFEDLFIDELKDLYDAENRIAHALPKLVKGAHSEPLSSALSMHLAQTEEHIARLEDVFDQVGQTPRRKTCKAMVGLLAEGEELLAESSDETLRDAAIVAAAQKVEHYEMATYGTLREWAQHLGHHDVIATLQKTLEEEESADKRLTELAATLNANAAQIKARA